MLEGLGPGVALEELAMCMSRELKCTIRDLRFVRSCLWDVEHWGGGGLTRFLMLPEGLGVHVYPKP